MKKKYSCFALFSGGLDSILAVLHMKSLGYRVLPIFFSTPFFGPDRAQETANRIGAKYSLILGQKELLDGTIIIRDMESGTQEVIDYKKIYSDINKRLETEKEEKN